MRRNTSLTAQALSAILLYLSTTPIQAAHTGHTEPHKTVAILLFDGVEIIDFAGPYEVFGQAGMGVFTVSEDGASVNTAMGLKTVPDYSFSSAPAFDVLLVPGGDVAAASADAEVQDFIRRHSQTSEYTLSVCTGSYLLAEAGILDGLQATTFHRALSGFQEQYPAIDVVRDVRWTDNGKILTSAGLSSGIDSALHVVAKLYGEDKARSTALHLEYDWHADGGFVRTRLADRYLPKIQLDWPQATRIEVERALGDEHYWRQDLVVYSALSPQQVLATITEAIAALPQWQSGDEKMPYQLSSQQEGHALRLSIQQLGAAQNESYRLRVELHVNS